MDENQRAAMEAVLADAVKQRDELNVVIRFMSNQLGKPAPEGSPPGGGLVVPEGATAAPGADPKSLVADAEFHGQSAPKATINLLERVGRTRPLKTGEIYHAIKKGGVQIKNQDGLYRTLHRDKRFRKVGVSLWGLEAWYPPRPKDANQDMDDDTVEAHQEAAQEVQENEAS